MILDCIEGSECLRIQNITPNLKKKKQKTKSLNWARHCTQEGGSLDVNIWEVETLGLQRCSLASSFMWAREIRAQVLMLARQSFRPLSHLLACNLLLSNVHHKHVLCPTKLLLARLNSTLWALPYVGNLALLGSNLSCLSPTPGAPNVQYVPLSHTLRSDSHK